MIMRINKILLFVLQLYLWFSVVIVTACILLLIFGNATLKFN